MLWHSPDLTRHRAHFGARCLGLPKQVMLQHVVSPDEPSKQNEPESE